MIQMINDRYVLVRHIHNKVYYVYVDANTTASTLYEYNTMPHEEFIKLAKYSKHYEK